MTDPRLFATNPVATLEGVNRAREARGAGPQISLVVFHFEQTRVIRLVEGQGLVLGRDPSAEI